jgi:uncharacterized Fe-S cluster-containing radical SAM superfamily protein
LWFNTGTLCNLECSHCYIESSPTNDSLVYLTLAEVQVFLDELQSDGWPTDEIGFTGGEPFMNPEFIDMLDSALSRGFRALVLTNAMRPMMKKSDELLALKQRFGERLLLRISLDHYKPEMHDAERGHHAWRRTLPGLNWLSANGFDVQVAGRTCWLESESDLRSGFAELFADLVLDVDAFDPASLVLFPEMDPARDVPEITEACWSILGVEPASMMCASSRMVERRKGEAAATVVPCTLLPYDKQFDMGRTLAEADHAVKLNHPFCAEFCVLGGASCSVHD